MSVLPRGVWLRVSGCPLGTTADDLMNLIFERTGVTIPRGCISLGYADKAYGDSNVMISLPDQIVAAILTWSLHEDSLNGAVLTFSGRSRS